MKKCLAAALIVIAGSSAASAQSGSVMGTWLVASKSAQVQIAPCPNPANGPICDTVVKLLEAKGPDGKAVADPAEATDVNNADPSLRRRKIVGIVLIHDFKKTNDPNAFEDGTIYNGENGKTYKANIRLEPDGTLRLRGYIGSTMFGETQIWTRVQ
jgi:uncharacterized protein (DUF2147 family)